MAWRRPGDKSLSGPMMISFLIHICVTRLQLVQANGCPVTLVIKCALDQWNLPLGQVKLWYLLLISMLWHRLAIFNSKGDKLSSSAECRIWTRGLRHQIASRLNARWQTDWAIEDQAKNLNSTASPYDQRAFSPPDSTASWLSHLALAIYIFVEQK